MVGFALDRGGEVDLAVPTAGVEPTVVLGDGGLEVVDALKEVSETLWTVPLTEDGTPESGRQMPRPGRATPPRHRSGNRVLEEASVEAGRRPVRE